MTDLSQYEREQLARIEATPDAEESLRERLALAVWNEGAWCGECDHRDFYDCQGCCEDSGRYADAAIAVMRGEP